MRTPLQLALLGLLLGTAAAGAQVFNPNSLLSPPPRNPARHFTPKRGDDLQWLWTFTRPRPVGDAAALRFDARFQAFLEDNFKQPQSMWGPPNTHEPLAALIPLFLSRYGTVTSAGNRYLTVDGCVPGFCAAAGLLWIDLGRTPPLAVFAAVNWNPDAHTVAEPDADYNLYLFPNHILDADGLPLPLTEAVSHWQIRLAAEHRIVPHIAHALLVEPTGEPHPLDPAMTGANIIAPQPAAPTTDKEQPASQPTTNDQQPANEPTATPGHKL